MYTMVSDCYFHECCGWGLVFLRLVTVTAVVVMYDLYRQGYILTMTILKSQEELVTSRQSVSYKASTWHAL